MLCLLCLSCGDAVQTPPAGDHGLSAGGVAHIDSVLASHRGEWVLVNIWATWCRPCRAETPELVALNRELAASPFVLIGIAMDALTSRSTAEATEKVRLFASAHEVVYPNIIYQGPSQPLLDRFGFSGAIPLSILIDPEGVEHTRWTGQLTTGDLGAIRAAVSGGSR